MACKSCEERRQAMKAYIGAKLEAAKHWARLRRGEPAADATATPGQAPAKAGTSTRAKPAGKAKPAHGKRRVAKAPRGGAGS